MRLSIKDEKTHLKIMRSFFFLQAIGHICRITKIDNSNNDANNQDKEINDFKLVNEGIFFSCDANSTHVILQ